MFSNLMFPEHILFRLAENVSLKHAHTNQNNQRVLGWGFDQPINTLMGIPNRKSMHNQFHIHTRKAYI